MEGATAPMLKIVYNYSTLIVCLNIVTGQPIRFIENIPEVIYYMLGHDKKEDPSIAVKKINKSMRDTTNIQITEIEFLEMNERLNANIYYYEECINITRQKIEYIV